MKSTKFCILAKSSQGPERNYNTTEKECVVIIYYDIKKLKPYFDGMKFKIETDHNPLVLPKTNAGNNQRY